MVGFQDNAVQCGSRYVLQFMPTLVAFGYDEADDFSGSEKIQKLKQKLDERSVVQTHT